MPKFINSRLGFFLLSAFTGLLVGSVTVALIECIGFLQNLFFGISVDDDPAEFGSKFTGWSALLIPILGGIVISLMLRVVPGQRFHGIADVMEASALRAGRMNVRSGATVAVATTLSLGAGVPLGREGPAVHIGASLTSWLAETFHLDRTQSLTLLGCAAAAAVTASFNTPIAGVIFALEVVVGYYALRVFSPVVVAALGAVIVRHSVYGNRSEFSLPDYQIGSLWELPAFAMLGFVAALVVQGFIYLVILSRVGWNKTPAPQWIRPAFAGVAIGILAIYYPLALGVGYEGTSLALNESLPLALLCALLIAKLLGGALAIGSGFPGGVFSPALFAGAMLGGVYWYFMQTVLPVDISSQGVYSVVGMAAVASAMLGAPISTLLIVFELTINYDLVIAVMLAAAMASTFMQLLPHSSFFRWQLSERGINLNTGRDQGLLRTRTIDEFVTKNFIEVEASSSLEAVESSMFSHQRYIAIVVGEFGEFVGSLSTDELMAGVVSDRSAECETAMKSTEHALPHSSSLLAALQYLNEHETNYAPVTKTGDDAEEVVGVIYRSDVLKALYDTLREARSEEYGVT